MFNTKTGNFKVNLNMKVPYKRAYFKPLPLIFNSSKKSRWRMIERATTNAKINST